VFSIIPDFAVNIVASFRSYKNTFLFLIDWNQDGRKELLLERGDGHVYLVM